jgi:hypothetical protein
LEKLGAKFLIQQPDRKNLALDFCDLQQDWKNQQHKSCGDVHDCKKQQLNFCELQRDF